MEGIEEVSTLYFDGDGGQFDLCLRKLIKDREIRFGVDHRVKATKLCQLCGVVGFECGETIPDLGEDRPVGIVAGLSRPVGRRAQPAATPEGPRPAMTSRALLTSTISLLRHEALVGQRCLFGARVRGFQRVLDTHGLPPRRPALPLRGHHHRPVRPRRSAGALCANVAGRWADRGLTDLEPPTSASPV